MVTRRSVMVLGASALVITGAAGWAGTRAPLTARAPWKSAHEGFGDPLLDFLAFALLAPNPHNMQPWRIHRLDETDFEVYADPSRLLPETDPPSRQITIGFGCFLEVFRQAAAERGWRASISPFLEGSDPARLDPEKPIARVRIEADETVSPDPLFQYALARRTNREPFDLDRAVENGALLAISQAAATRDDVGFANDAPTVEKLRRLALDAWEIEWATPQTRKESVNVTRIGKGEINETPWGLSLPGAFPEAMKTLGILTKSAMDEPGSIAFDESFKYYADACKTASAFIWLTTNGNERERQLDAGRSWVRMHLKATELGIAFHPLSQALQEFSEMSEPYSRAHEMLAPQGGTVQMLVRLGFAKSPAPAPREPLMAKLVAL